MEALLAAGGLAAGLGAGLTGIAHASDPTRPGQAWNEISLPFDSGKGSGQAEQRQSCAARGLALQWVPGRGTAPGTGVIACA